MTDMSADRPSFDVRSRPVGAPLALGDGRGADFSHFLAEPVGSRILADLGAEVVKIEKIHGGDDFRRVGPMVCDDAGGPFVWGNRNKRSIALDLKQPEGVRVAREIARRSDILVENFSTGLMDKLGLWLRGDADDQSQADLSLYLGVRPIGAGSVSIPSRVESGYMSMRGARDALRAGDRRHQHRHDREQRRARGLVRSGAPGHRSVYRLRFVRSAATMTGFHAMNDLVSGRVPPRFGDDSLDTVPTAAFQASDGPLCITCSNDRTYERLVGQAMQRPELATDPDFATDAACVRNRARLLAMLGDVFATDTRANWAAQLRAARVPGAPINDLAEAFGSEEMRERGLVSWFPAASHLGKS